MGIFEQLLSQNSARQQQNMPQQYPNQYQQPYPSSYGNPTMQDLLLKSLYPQQNGGAFNSSDWLKLGLGLVGNIWNKHKQDEEDTPMSRM